MQKHPTYIGVFAIDSKAASKQIKAYSRECIQEVLGRVNSLYVQQDYNSFDQNFNHPKDNHHITTLFLGGNPNSLKKNQSQMYKEFKPNVKVPIVIEVCVYVPGVILAGYCPEVETRCDNKCPHATLMLAGDTKPVQSNTVLEMVINQFPDICKQDFVVKEAKEKYKGKSIFIIRRKIIIQGITGDNFKNGSRK